MTRFAFVALCVTLWILSGAVADSAHVFDLAPSADNPRNSEGDFITLNDGRILFVYTHFTGGADDASTAHLASRVSTDDGRTWSAQDAMVLPNEGGNNVMSVTMRRMRNGQVGLFYLRKDSSQSCRMYLRTSKDEAQTWSEPTLCIPDEGYYVVNNDRIAQLSSGRLVAPAADHTKGERGKAMCYLSDDDGQTWRRSRTVLEAPEASKSGLQEPAVVELKDGRLLMLCRTDQGCQMRSFSSDGGETWSPVEKTDLLSPVSPATVERIPESGELVVVWNDHNNIDPALKNKRTPLTVAVSKDEGATWERRFNLEDNPAGWYCYTAMHFVKDAMLLGYCAGDTSHEQGLSRTRLRRVELEQVRP